MTQKHYPGSNGNKTAFLDAGKEGVGVLCLEDQTLQAYPNDDYVNSRYIQEKTDYTKENAHDYARKSGEDVIASQAQHLNKAQAEHQYAKLKQLDSRMFTVDENLTGNKAFQARCLQYLRKGECNGVDISWLNDTERFPYKIEGENGKLKLNPSRLLRIDDEGEYFLNTSSDQAAAFRVCIAFLEKNGRVNRRKDTRVSGLARNPECEQWSQEIRHLSNVNIINDYEGADHRPPIMTALGYASTDTAPGFLGIAIREELEATLTEEELEMVYGTYSISKEKDPTLAELKQECKENGFRVSGKVAELMERLGKISVKGQERWNVSLDFRSEMVRAVISLVSTRKCQVGKKYGVCAHENITWGVFKDHLLKLHAQITGKRRRAGSARAMVMNYHFPSVLLSIFKRHREFVTVNSKNGSEIYSDPDLFALTG